ncbi:MAG: anthranilate phosphoribosyltransferase [bacterium]
MKEDFIKELLGKAVNNIDLTKNESYGIFDAILKGELTNAQIASFLTSLKIKGETVGEIAGAALAMRENAAAITVKDEIKSLLVDTCGTGGDSKSTFNISTCAALIAAGAGVKIAKHGNYAVSSKSGSADVLKELGVNISLDAEGVLRSIEYANIGFLFAPKFHTAMKYAAPVRKELGFKTIFNILGPLTNPLGVKKQVIGVYSDSLSKKIVEVLKVLNAGKTFVVHSRDGMDEISLSSITDIYELTPAGDVKYFEFNPKEYGFSFFEESEFKSLSVASNAKIIYDIISGHKSPRAELAILNAGFAILASGKADNLYGAFNEARYSIESGNALRALQNLIEISNK